MKASKTKLRAKCDKLVGAIWRLKGRCDACLQTTGQLQWVHFITRREIRLRYDERNNACFCAGCHRRGHDDPLWMVETWDRIKGRGTAEALHFEARSRPYPIKEQFYLDTIDRFKKGDL